MPKFLSLIILLLGVFIPSKVLAANFPDYEIHASIDVDSHSIKAKQSVKFRNNFDSSLGEVYFHIYPNKKYSRQEQQFIYQFAGYFKVNPFPEGFQQGKVSIHYVRLGDKDLEFSLEGEDETLLKVKLPLLLKKGEGVNLEISYDVKIPHSYGRFGWHKDIIALHRFYPILSVFDKEGWHNYPSYLYHQPYLSDASTYKLILTLPKDQIIAHTGILVNETYQNDGRKTVTLQSENPTRDFSLAISPNYKLIRKRCANILVKSFYLKGDSYYGEKAAEFACDCLDYYSRAYGEYPYKEFSIAPVFLASGGYETSNMIFIDTRVYKLPKFLIRYFDFLISHETGHQWWFNVVGSDEYKETWLDEGLNSYSLLNYLESKYGEDTLVLELPRFLRSFLPNFSFRDSSTFRYLYMARNGLDRPILGPLSGFKEPSSIFALTYGKGAKVFSMLEFLMGEEKFSLLLREYYQEFKFSNASVKDFKTMAEELYQGDLNVFFQQWLETDEICDFAIKQVKDNLLIIENKGSIFMPLEIEVEFQDNQLLRRIVEFKAKEEEIKFAKKIKSVRLDPDNRILEIDKTNNSFPLRIAKKIVPLHFFVYDIPLFLEQGAYNLITGPSVGSTGLGIKSSLHKPYDWNISLGAGYDFNDGSSKTSIDILKKQLFGKQMSMGFSFFNQHYDGPEDDLRGGKIFLRRELWPAAYGLMDTNDHITFYLLRNQQWKGSSLAQGGERIGNLYYRKHEEAIVGATLHFSRRGPYPDFSRGFSLDSTFESAGHFLGGEESFWRIMQEGAFYKPVDEKGTIAARIKFGWGGAQDKKLFQLGGMSGLRGYRNKTIEGSRAFLSSIEYRLFLLQDLNIGYLDNIINLDDIQAVCFFDIGKAWNGDYSQNHFKKDAGIGLRFHFDIGSFFERIILRLDVAKAINDSGQGTRTWLGISHTF